jgi:putative peptidoglycan lipid II flippase
VANPREETTVPQLRTGNPAQKITSFWRRQTTGSVNRQVLGAAATIGILASFARLASVGKELIVARRFGTGTQIESFLVAVLIPFLAIGVLSTSLSMALIPTYINVREREGRAAAQDLLSGVTVWSLLLLSLTTVLIVAGAGLYMPWIASGFNQMKLNLAYQLLWIVAPMVIMSGIANIWGAVLNAAEHFALVALAPIITPSVTLAMLFVLKPWGIYALAIGMVVGALFEMVLLGIALRLRGISLRPRWLGINAPLRQIGGQFLPRVGASLLRSGSIVVDRSLAATLSHGSVATLNYGNRITMTVLALAGAALGSALTPYYSKMTSQHDWRGLLDTLSRFGLLILLVSIPLVVILSVFAVPVVQFVFERGSFRAKDTHLVAQVQALYALQIPFYLGTILVSRLLGSLLASHILVWGAFLNLLLTVVLDVILIRHMGISGLALATSCATLVTFCFLGYYAIKTLRDRESQSLAKKD